MEHYLTFAKRCNAIPCNLASHLCLDRLHHYHLVHHRVVFVTAFLLMSIDLITMSSAKRTERKGGRDDPGRERKVYTGIASIECDIERLTSLFPSTQARPMSCLFLSSACDGRFQLVSRTPSISTQTPFCCTVHQSPETFSRGSLEAAMQQQSGSST
jgi:hypothetical protein